MLIIKRNNNIDLHSLFGLYQGDKTAIIGCGGKTSLMFALARGIRDCSVLVTTTTHIFRPPACMYDFVLDKEPADINKGIYLLYGGEKDGKLVAPTTDSLAEAQNLFDFVFIEADGSNMRPLKGWKKYEPVIPDFVTATIAVATISPIGKAISEENTHRMPVFCRITGSNPGEAVTAAHVADMISSPYGMLQKALGKKILFINQTDLKDGRIHALNIFDSLPKDFTRSLSRIIVGSIRENEYELIWEGNGNDPKHS